MKFLLIILSLFSFVSSGQQITNYETPGNLESKYSLNCIKKEKVKNIYTPADIYPPIAKCIKKKKYKRAIDLFMIAGAYGYYDAFRVSDVSARAAISALQANNLWGLDEAKKLKFKEEFESYSKSEESMANSCKFLTSLGKPNYHPSYMINHGLKAVMGEGGDGLLPDYDSNSIWEDALKKYVKCKN